MVHQHHFLFVTFPAQGHINPALQLARRLTTIGGVHVTFLVNTHTRRSMLEVPNYGNFTLSEFSDGYDDGPTFEQQDFPGDFKRRATQALKDIIANGVDGRRPITCLVYCLFVPWVAQLARELHVPAVFFWVQPAIVFDIYFYYFNRVDDVDKKINNCESESESESDNSTWSITFPKFSIPFTKRDIPSLIKPTNRLQFAKDFLQEHMETLGKEKNPKVLVNTFDALESEALSAISDIDLVAVGPLDIPSGSSAAVNMFKLTDRNKYISWLNTKPESSVVYISFGSLVTLSDKHVEGIKKGLLASGKHSLWVMRSAVHHHEPNEDDNATMMTVSWCDQNEVLSHPSVGCFLTHCGWNSTLESMVAGKPIVAFPQFGDQVTNAMLVELWNIGVRVNADDMNGDGDEGLARAGDEINRCLEIVLGDGVKGEEIRKNAIEYKTLALDALKEKNGSSDKNLRSFVEQLSTSSTII